MFAYGLAGLAWSLYQRWLIGSLFTLFWLALLSYISWPDRRSWQLHRDERRRRKHRGPADTVALMPVNSRASRREQRRGRVAAAFGPSGEAALDLLELTEFAWHDCYGEASPPDEVVNDILTVAQGRLDSLVHAARLAVEDYRDLRMQAAAISG